MTILRQAESPAAFLRDPIGRWIHAGTSLIWAASPSLGGVAAWGRPDAQTSAAALAMYEAIFAPTMAAQVDVVLDGRRLEIDSDALTHFIGWLRTNLPRFRPRIRLQVGIARDDLPGLILTGILPILGAGETHPYRVFTDVRAGFRHVGAEPLVDVVDGLVERAAGLPQLIANLRVLLRERRVGKCSVVLGGWRGADGDGGQRRDGRSAHRGRGGCSAWGAESSKVVLRVDDGFRSYNKARHESPRVGARAGGRGVQSR